MFHPHPTSFYSVTFLHWASEESWRLSWGSQSLGEFCTKESDSKTVTFQISELQNTALIWTNIC